MALVGPEAWVCKVGSPANLLPLHFKDDISRWLAEDAPSFDYGGFVAGSEVRNAYLLQKSPGRLAGVPFFNEIFRQLGCEVSWGGPHGKDGDPESWLLAPTVPWSTQTLATVSGPTRQILLGERVALNILARCSGIATKSVRVKKLARDVGYVGIIAGTRKTTPGFRLVEKYGMLIGGIDAHRHDLSSMVMLKDNHIWASKSITQAVEAARVAAGFSLKIEVECQSEAEADEAIKAGADIVMLDNFDGPGLKVAARNLKNRWKGQKVLLECSGGLTEENMAEYLTNDIDIYSTSSVHQGVPHVDFSLKLEH